jgi:hypothetical protein
MVMRLSVKYSASLLALSALALCATPSATAQSTAATTAGNGTYMASDPLANVRYDNRFDASLGAAYGHIMAGPTRLQGANLGGLDLSASYWWSKHWAVEGTGRAYLGSSGANPNSVGLKGPFVSEYIVAGGPEWLGPHNKHGALVAHVLVGGAHFDSHLKGNLPSVVDFYPNQFAPAAIFGGHFDMNRSPRWVFRVTPDALFTRYSFNYTTLPPTTSPKNNWNFGISVGVMYKFQKKR